MPDSITVLHLLLILTRLKYIALILLCLGTSIAHAQTLKGKVQNATTGEPLYPVSVINLRTQQVSYTNKDGYYKIYATAGDKVAFSFIGYKNKQYQMPVSVGDYTGDIALEPISYMLDEVILMPDYTPYQIDSIENVKTYRPFLTRTKSSPIASPFSFVAEKFSRRSKQIFKFQKKFSQWEDERYVDTRYTPELVEKMTGLSGDSVGHFMNAYPMPYDYARAATELEMKMWIKYNYKAWMKHVDTAGLPQIDQELIPETEQK